MSERNLRRIETAQRCPRRGLYLVGAWLLTQVASTVLPVFGAPDWLPGSIVVVLAIGFIPALIFSWVFEITPEGLITPRCLESPHSSADDSGRYNASQCSSAAIPGPAVTSAIVRW